MTNFCEIELTKICPNPKNPRRHYDARKLDELTASVKSKGVIEPIIVRPLQLREGCKGKIIAGVQYEIVAGERRFRASTAAGLATIPAIVRELDDDEAYDFMLIENLQRDDLTDREEAESFKAYVGRHKKDGIPALAEKTGISPAYIRARVRVLELPANVLKAWDEGKLVFGHLQQLLRVAKDEATLAKVFGWTVGTSRWSASRVETVEDLRRYIDGLAPALNAALFKTEGVCDSCASNSTVQRELFDIATDKVRCHNPSCFKQHQLKAIAAGWKTSALGKSCGTNRAVIDEEHRVAYHGFYGNKPTDKCRACPDFGTIVAINGEVTDRQVCFGKDACHSSLGRQRSTEKREKRDPGQPRATWHGEHFRDVFLSKRIPEALAKLNFENPKIKPLLLACAIHNNRGPSDDRHEYSGWILVKPENEIRAAAMKAIEAIVLSGQHVGPTSWNGFGTKGRRLVAEYLGIDLAKEFVVDKDYLDAKTKAEILAFGKKFKLLKMDKATKLKKSELVGLVLDHGPALVGKVPAEILK